MTTKEFVKLVEEEAWKYLRAGDQAYTEQGLTLQTMFMRFRDNDALILDFAKWVIARRTNRE